MISSKVVMQLAKTLIIAEAGVNHNGDIVLAKQLIDVAASCGADVVKFQTFSANALVNKTAKMAKYQMKNTGSVKSQFDLIKSLELDFKAHVELKDYCKKRKIEFWSTAFDIDSLSMLDKEFSFKFHKVPSGELTNAPFLLEFARTGKKIILSTGMSLLSEVEMALCVLAYGYTMHKEPISTDDFKRAYYSDKGQKALKQKVTLLHCTTEYPAPFADVNLLAMDTLQKSFGLCVGLSDHSDGIAVAIAAVARGACVIEKHFTLDKNMPGPDHKASLNPDELENLVKSIRQVELALGDGIKRPALSEISNIKVARKSLVALQNIKKGEVFTKENVGAKRPGDGLSPMFFWDIVGKKANRDYKKDEFL